MPEYIVKHKMGLPVWDDDRVVDIKEFLPGSTITTEDFEAAKQDDGEQDMLIHHNCFSEEELQKKADTDAALSEMRDLDAQQLSLQEEIGDQDPTPAQQEELDRVRERLAQLRAAQQEVQA